MRVQSNLARIREARGLSVGSLAAQVGVKRQTIYAIESGKYIPNTEVALCLAQVLKVSVEELFSVEKELKIPVKAKQVDLLPIPATAWPSSQTVQLCEVGNHWVGVPSLPIRAEVSAADATVGDANSDTSRFVPILLWTAGASNSFYTSALTLTNRGDKPAIMDFIYTAAISTGSGTASDFLLPGEQRVLSNAITYLKILGVPIPDSGNRGGTLQIHFWGIESPLDVAATVRTTTQVTNGRAGLSYQGVPPTGALTKPAYIFGLRQNAADRSDLAIQNAGTDVDGDVVLSITIYPGDPGQTMAINLPDEVLPPGGFKQFNSILGMDGVGLSNGFVRVERISGAA